MATANVNNNYATVNVADHMVVYAGRLISQEELDWYNADADMENQLRRERYELEQAEKAKKEHTLDELVSMMALLAQSIEALRKEVADHA